MNSPWKDHESFVVNLQENPEVKIGSVNTNQRQEQITCLKKTLFRVNCALWLKEDQFGTSTLKGNEKRMTVLEWKNCGVLNPWIRTHHIAGDNVLHSVGFGLCE